MQNNWSTQTVQALQHNGILLVEDGNHGESRPRPDEFNDNGTPFIRAADMQGGRIHFASASRITSAALARIRKGIGCPGDILLSHKGTVGKLAFAPSPCEPFVCSPQTTFWRVLDESVLDRRFLYFFMRSRLFSEQLDAVKGETDMADYVSLTAQRRLRIPLPELGLQRSIAAILGALEDKINLNRNVNETLEAMTQATFKDWFIDFGPTRGKMERRASYLSPDVWALFPDRLDDDGKPRGWPQKELLDLCQLKRGYDLPSAQRTAGSVPIVSSSGISGYHGSAMVDGPGVVTGRYGTIGQVFFINRPYWPLNTALYVRDFKGNSPCFVFYTLSNLDFHTYSDKGAVPGINRNHLHQAPILLPPTPVQASFEDFLTPLWSRAAANASESETLVSIRDLLLPKLMSGEIRIGDAERELEVVA
jgi:type I restriction enzyme, S subunit